MQKQGVRLCGGPHYGRRHHRAPSGNLGRAVSHSGGLSESDAKRTTSIKANTAATFSGPSRHM
jgi:hypothetical protein